MLDFSRGHFNFKSERGPFTQAVLSELFEEAEKSFETLTIMARSSAKVAGRAFGS